MNQTSLCEQCGSAPGRARDGASLCDSCLIYRTVLAVGEALSRGDFDQARLELELLPRGGAASRRLRQNRLMFGGLIEERAGNLDLALSLYRKAAPLENSFSRPISAQAQAQALRRVGRVDAARSVLVAALDSSTRMRARSAAGLLVPLAEMGAGPNEVPGWWTHWRASARAFGVPGDVIDALVDPIEAIRLLKQAVNPV